MRLLQSSAFSRIVLGLAVVGLSASLQLDSHPAQAQLLDQLKGAAGGSAPGGSALGGLGGGGLPSVGQAGASNTAGVLQYCVKNNYLSGNGAASVKDSLMSKVTGSGQGTSDSGYKQGSSGLLDTGNGQKYNLGSAGGASGGIKEQVQHKVCDLVLQHAKSML